ncbi:SAV_2336 N-terminal domain-related protein [Streptomyces sp. KL118A]|uniref:SAV_2336 N-terminal domain-related protein n=1 Tax=Streptomyces sp. KL118A TaxID=3045153 RepID=UPI00278C4B5A|nr:SAV_2336 N-terminal domain-related protein [Streptomyces sp. KL118A]
MGRRTAGADVSGATAPPVSGNVRHELARLIACTRQDAAGVEDVTDLLWMAGIVGLRPANDSSGQPSPGPTPASTDRSDVEPPHRVPSGTATDESPSEQTVQVFSASDPGADSPAQQSSRRGEGIRVPQPPALTAKIDCARALRPWRQFIPAPVQRHLDERATAAASAEARRLLPVWREGRQLRYSVDLVVDCAPTMAVWHKLAAELGFLLGHHGSFRDVRCWHLDTSKSSPRIAPFRRNRTNPSGLSSRWHQRLDDTSGRRLLLVLTDGVGPAWRAEDLRGALARWSRSRPVAVLQVLPRRLWHRTALHALPVDARVADLRLPLVTWDAQAPLFRVSPVAEPTDPGWVLVMELDAEWLGPWSTLFSQRVVGRTRMLATPLAAALPVDSHRHLVRSVQKQPQEPLDPAARVSRFRSGASHYAFRLACHLSAAPLSLPVIRLVQRATVPESGPMELAEVLLSGLLRRRSTPQPDEDPETVVYDFLPGVRDELLSSLTKRESVHVLADVVGRVSGHVARTFGGTLDFRALAADPVGDPITGGQPLPTDALPFAEVAVAVLRGAGGAHRELAHRLSQALAVEPDAESVHRRARLTSGDGGDAASRIRLDIMVDMVSLLSTVPALESASARELLTEMVGDDAGSRPSLPRGSAPRVQLLHLVRFCAKSQMLVGLVQHLRSMAPDLSQVGELQRLAEQWEALDKFPVLAERWTFLKDALAGLSLSYSDRSRLFRRATGQQAADPPSHCSNPWDDLIHLALRGADAGKPPPWMRYLDQCGTFMEMDTAGEVLALNRTWAMRFGSLHELDLMRTVKATELPVDVVQDPSQGFTVLPGGTARGPDITVSFDVLGHDRIRARMYGPALAARSSSEHRADLAVGPAEVQTAAVRLRRLWQDLLVEESPPDDGDPLVDLRTRPTEELHRTLSQLAQEGQWLLFDLLLGGEERQTRQFREHLAGVLAAHERLRVRFDSELRIPWPMVCLRPEDVPQPAAEPSPTDINRRFLGYRHLIEQTDGYPPLPGRAGVPQEVPEIPTVSLNHDVMMDAQGRTRADEVAAVLARDTHFVERTTRSELMDDLADPGMSEQLMYFWCHGNSVQEGGGAPSSALALSDGTPIDAAAVRQWRRSMGDGGAFQPFVLLNACNSGALRGDYDVTSLGQALIREGAKGVLAPEIQMPQSFAAEYALQFLTRYLAGHETAGEVVHSVARHFAEMLHNPLALTYALHYGMDARLERSGSSAT